MPLVQDWDNTKTVHSVRFLHSTRFPISNASQRKPIAKKRINHRNLSTAYAHSVCWIHFRINWAVLLTVDLTIFCGMKWNVNEIMDLNAFEVRFWMNIIECHFTVWKCFEMIFNLELNGLNSKWGLNVEGSRGADKMDTAIDQAFFSIRLCGPGLGAWQVVYQSLFFFFSPFKEASSRLNTAMR